MRAQLTVKDLMTEAVLSIEVVSLVSEALRLFAEYPVNHLPVVRERRLVGMLSSADIRKLKGFLPKGASTAFVDERFSIDALMSQPVISIRPEQSAEAAARLMVTHAIHALPVVSAEDRLLGIVTTTDMMQAFLTGASQAKPRAGRPNAASPPGPAAPIDLDAAVTAAREAVAAERDTDGMAQALLYCQERVAVLEEFRELVRGYAEASHEELAMLAGLRTEEVREVTERAESA